MGKELKDKMIADIMDGFDFEKVRDVMQSLDWKWAIGHGEMAVPSIWRITEQAKRLLEDVTNGDEGTYRIVSTGGFMAIRYEDGSLSLHFNLESFDADIDIYEEEER